MAEPKNHLRIGSILHNGSYRIEKVLGQGGFGITYLATDLSLDRKVAIKEFFPKDYCDRNEDTSHVTLGTQSNKDFIDKLKIKFLKEARNIAKLDFPGIIKIFAAFEENDTAYYVMEYIEGASLSDLVKRRGPLPVNVALKYIDKVGRALEYVHARKINHLDVKPANIMLRASDDQPILIDFGLSKQYDHSGNQTSTTPVGISHGYAPMEQYNIGGVKEFSPQTDLYSLAATLYYLVTGATPKSALELFDEGVNFPPGFPSRLMSPISQAMSPSKRDRHMSVALFVKEIDNTSAPLPDDSATSIAGVRTSGYGKNIYQAETQINSMPAGGNTNTKSVSDSPQSKKNNTLIFIVAGAVLIIIVLIGIIIGMKNDRSTDSSEAEAVSQAINSNSTATVGAEKPANITPAVAPNNTESQSPPVSANQPSVRFNRNDPYVIVVGSTTSPTEASNIVSEFHRQHSNLQFDITVSEGRHRIYAGTGSTVKEANQSLPYLRSLFPNAWVVKRDDAGYSSSAPAAEPVSSVRFNYYDPYVVVIGSTTSPSEASKLISKFSRQYPNLQFAETISEGRHRIYAATGSSASQAKQQLPAVRPYFPNAWVVRRED